MPGPVNQMSTSAVSIGLVNNKALGRFCTASSSTAWRVWGTCWQSVDMVVGAVSALVRFALTLVRGLLLNDR